MSDIASSSNNSKQIFEIRSKIEEAPSVEETEQKEIEELVIDGSSSSDEAEDLKQVKNKTPSPEISTPEKQE